MAELSAYIPQDRRRALAAGVGLPDRADGAALLADVSGFTPLAEDLAARLGRLRGAEELTTLLNQVYDVLIAAVERCGGSVVGFAGDALIGWFADNPPHGQAGASQHALAAALALQQAMRPFHAVPVPGGPSAALAIKVAVASGPARRFVVGDPAIQLLDVLAGRTIDRLGVIAAGAAPGEVLADRTTIERVGDSARLGSWRAAGAAHAAAVVLALAGPGLPQPPAAAAPLPDTTAAPWVLPAVRAHLLAGGDALLAELRPISALMLQFSGIDYDADPDAHPRLDAFIRQVQRTLARYEGVLLDVMMADQGGYLYAICGAPLSHEDDGRRLLRVALVLRETRPAGLALRMGLSQGTLRAGPYGSAERRAYGALGDAANLAHRLMRHAAPGEVLVSAESQAGLAGQFSWEALTPLQVKGKQQLVAAYQALAELGAHARIPADPADALIGRASERAALAEALGALGVGVGGTLLISGDPGIGKSRLVGELQAQAQARGVWLYLGAGDAVEQTTPYAAWRPVVRELLGLVGDLGGQAEAAPALAALAERAPLLNEVLGLGVPESALTAQLRGQTRADNTSALLLELLAQAAAREPLLVVLEDAHWLDSASWTLALRVQRELPQALLVATLRRSAHMQPEERRLRAGPGVRELALDALADIETLALVRKRLGVADLPEPLVALIQARAEGNPFFSVALAAALLATGLITVAMGVCRVAPGVNLQEAALPATVQGVVASWVDRLRPEQQRVLKVASVIGRVFGARVLRDVHPVAGEQAAVAAILEELRRLDLTPREPGGAEATYTFKHVILQEATYDRLLYAQRRALHAAVAEWYEQTYGDDDTGAGLAPYDALLAHHWLRAEQPAHALPYLERAGERALQAGAYREAAASFEQILDLAGDAEPQQQARWHRMYGEALLGLALVEKSREQLEQALDVLGLPIRSRDLGWLLRQNLVLMLILLARRVLPFHSHTLNPTTLETIRVNQMLSVIYAYDSEGLSSVYTTLQSAIMLTSPWAQEERYRLYAALGVAAGLSSQYWLADRFFRDAQAGAMATDHQPALTFALQAEGLYRSGIGDWSTAYSVLETAARLAQLRQDRRVLAEVITHIGTACWFRGDYEEALASAERLRTEARRADNMVYQVWATNIEGLCLMRLGRFSEAQVSLEASWRARHNAGMVGPTRCSTSYGLVMIYLSQGRTEEAVVVARDVADHIGRPFPVFYLNILGSMVIAQVALARWQAHPRNLALARAALAACVALLGQSWLFPIGRPQAWLCLGRAAMSIGLPWVARALWHRSLRAARRLAMPYDQGLAHMALGQASSGPTRRAHFGQASRSSRASGPPPICGTPSMRRAAARVSDAVRHVASFRKAWFKTWAISFAMPRASE